MYMETADFAGIDLQPNSNPNYVDLVAHFDSAVAPSLPKASAANLRSALNQFLLFHEKSLSNTIGQEFGADFGNHLADFLKSQRLSGASEGSIANRKSDIRKWEGFYSDFFLRAVVPCFETLHEAVKYYVEKAQTADPKLSGRKICSRAGFTPSFLPSIFGKKYPDAKYESRGKYARLEEVLGAPTGAFTSFVRNKMVSNARVGAGTSEYGKKIQRLTREPYRLTDIPTQLRNEFSDLFKFKTSVSAYPLKRNQKWGLREISEYRSNFTLLPYSSTEDGKHYSPSSTLVFELVRSFFGVLKIKGYDPDKFSLAFLSEPDLLHMYLEYMSNRVGSLTTTSTQVLGLAESLLLKKVGFLQQHPKYSSRLLTPVPADQWENVCEHRRQIICELHANLKKDRLIKQGRNPFEQIKDILDRQHPITALLEIAANIRSYIKTEGRVIQEHALHALERDALLFDILLLQPLRVRMFCLMTYKKDNSGHLYQRVDGTWAIRFKPEEFKNEKGAAQRPYDVPLPDYMAPKIEHYLRNIRPRFENDSVKVFVPRKQKRKKLEMQGTGTGFIPMTIEKRSLQFLPGCRGFRPHSARHIVATDYIRNNPNGFQVAADVLHDKLETVLKHYAHLKAEDGHKHYQTFLATVKKEWEAAA